MTQTEKVFRVAIVAVTLLFAVSGVSGDTCTAEKVIACLKPLKDMNVDSADVGSLGLEQMKKVCRVYAEFSSCMKPMKGNCDAALEAQFASLDGGFRYLCEESTTNEYTKHAECLSKKELETKTKECATNLASAQATDKTKACGIFSDYLKCVDTVVTPVCGADAAKFMRNLTEHFLKFLTEKMDCPPFQSSGVSRLTSVGTTLLLLVLSALTAIGL